ncbi:MAG: hypothetical protein J6Y36_09410 [Treponema sp.]|nr:hypothetical protein [Treponema sp.]
MAIILQNSNLKLRIETPGEKYSGSRFDWNGTVTQIWFKNKKILSNEKTFFKRNNRIYGRGLHNEFGIKNPLGYDEVSVGEYFPKIGTGWLVKDEKPYYFYTQYKLKMLDYSWVKVSDSKAVFMCTSGTVNGYGYSYTKTIELNGDTFTIHYELENTGDKKIETSEYIHNFLLPCGRNIGSQIEIEFNWEYNHEKLSERVNIDNVVEFENNGVVFKKEPEKEFFIGGIYESRLDSNFNKNASWIIRDKKDGLTISESADFATFHCDVWGHKKCLSPELFKWISLDTGKTEKWNRTYSFTD